MKTLEELPVWQAGRKLVRKVYALTRSGPCRSDSGFCDQIQRAAVSVPSNIAEGHERGSTPDLIQFLFYAKGSAGEVIRRFRSHPNWLVFDYPGPQAGIMNKFWGLVSEKSFPYRRIFGARLALTLRHHGVTEFATRNVKDFQGFGFKRVWDPVAE